jgi:predicted ester cyclase
VAIEANKVLIQRFIDVVLNEGNTDAIDDFCLPGSMFAGGLVGQVRSMKTIFPDLHHTVEYMICEGDRVAVRVKSEGTNTGPMVGMPAFGRLEKPVPPTGVTVVSNAIYIFKVVDGKIISYSAEMDQIGMLRQMGWTFTPPASG